MTRSLSALTLLALAGGCAALSGSDPAEERSRALERGRYLVTIMDCGGCHTPGALAGEPERSRALAGSSIGFGSPFGVVYPPNLTPDEQTGMGGWSEDEIVAAVTQGRRPDGRALAPVMPWPMYSALTGEDARAIAAYLKSLAPISNRTPDPVPAGQQPTSPYLNLVVP